MFLPFYLTKRFVSFYLNKKWGHSLKYLCDLLRDECSPLSNYSLMLCYFSKFLNIIFNYCYIPRINPIAHGRLLLCIPLNSIWTFVYKFSHIYQYLRLIHSTLCVSIWHRGLFYKMKWAIFNHFLYSKFLSIAWELSDP